MQFYLEDGIGDEEAVSLIDLEVPNTDLRETRMHSMDSDGILWSSTHCRPACTLDHLHALKKLSDVTL